MRFALAMAKQFQFTRPRGARLGYTYHFRATARFNSRAHGGRDIADGAPLIGLAFQFTRPRGARRGTMAQYKETPMFQFTRPRGARHAQLIGTLTQTVSIHAPTGGATGLALITGHPACFNSRAHGGRDGRSSPGARATGGFNSRAHGGRDSTRRTWRPPARFQFTRPRGARLRVPWMRSLAFAFQFTRPRGARLRGWACSVSTPSFNSRAHGGRDLTMPSCWVAPSPFQFTRPRGARRNGGAVYFDAVVSIHAPTGGATCAPTRPRMGLSFQFTRPRGARQHLEAILHQLELFQFTRPRGARLAGVRSHPRSAGFNSRAHGGRDTRERMIGALICSFNSRAHGGRDGRDRVARLCIHVSIHAPTGGATDRARVYREHKGFNSRAHGGRDPILSFGFRHRDVSIHAPTGGATKVIGRDWR